MEPWQSFGMSFSCGYSGRTTSSQRFAPRKRAGFYVSISLAVHRITLLIGLIVLILAVAG